MKVALIILAIAISLAVLLELGLRLFFGFGNPLLYVPDEKIGYLLAPGQKVRRFGNRIEINQYSMRSPAVAPTRPNSTLRVLLLGDSVANGGWWTDQAHTISMMLSQTLQSQIRNSAQNSPFTTIEILNASANSWGPRNELAYLKRFGSFDAQVIVLLLNTDDLFAAAPSPLVVGQDRNYPDRKPPLAIVELISRYLLPAPHMPAAIKALNDEPGDRVGINLTAIQQVHHLASQNQQQFLLALTPLLRETLTPGPRDYEVAARERLLRFTQTEQIHYLDFLPAFQRTAQAESLFRDHIHLSPTGNQVVSEGFREVLQPLLWQKPLFVKKDAI